LVKAPVPSNEAVKVALSPLGALTSKEVIITFPLYCPVVKGVHPPVGTTSALAAYPVSKLNTTSISVLLVQRANRSSKFCPSPSNENRLSVLIFQLNFLAALFTHLPPESLEEVSTVSVLIDNFVEVANAIDLYVAPSFRNIIKSLPFITFAIVVIWLF